ncbi:alanine--glyoxylate aminotransferase family protein [Alicyclobacillus sp. SO9]|uniref:pyridoxal-phosphate-dependent aminotransferase family protein n=1 Tax=Alicyclobacillus sp. SO9 TaxID=2665646 RepID=UPI0018E7F738|nr:alanine--glyoxylate aminotransferase family protein [Alicyclobacillus sp. SO9]QQE77552.1 alanine--glyoxylate aminotransferase family protein [Alicyclobacillus sp. SO9]
MHIQSQNRLLLGPGPSSVSPEVLKAMSTPLVGHLDPYFLEVMSDMQNMLRQTFQTKNELTLAMSGTGSAGMETVFVNLVEPGDKVLIGICGVFGERMKDVAQRCGADVLTVEAQWGTAIQPEQVEQVLKSTSSIKAVALVHAETSTGVRQPLQEISRIVHNYGALFIVDTVTSLGGIPVEVDKMQIDACYSGTQKCLSAPPGLSPVTLSSAALNVVKTRKQKVQSWYLDLNMIANYWGEERFYHHTAPISMIFSLHEALRLLLDEGLENSFARHARNGQLLQSELEAMGLTLFAQEGYRLPELTSVVFPEEYKEGELRRRLLHEYGIEVGGGLGPLKDKAWRIGLMGHSSTLSNVTLLVQAMKNLLH